jgi:hypothetical protein
MVGCGVFFEVRIEFLNTVYTNFGFKELMQGGWDGNVARVGDM